MNAIRRLHYPIVSILAASMLGGTCSDPPPYHDVSGVWANATWGPDATMTSSTGEVLDVDIVMNLHAAVPEDRAPMSVMGSVCLRDPMGGPYATYAIDPEASSWSGADYGGARLDLVARGANGRTLRIRQAFMYSSSPDKLDDALVDIPYGADGTNVSFTFEGFVRRTDLSCP